MSATQSTVQLLPLAKELDENKVTPGVLGFVVFAVIGLAVWMLMKSMTKQMKKVDFEEAPEEPPAGAPARAATESGAAESGANEPGDPDESGERVPEPAGKADSAARED